MFTTAKILFCQKSSVFNGFSSIKTPGLTKRNPGVIIQNRERNFYPALTAASYPNGGPFYRKIQASDLTESKPDAIIIYRKGAATSG